MSGKRKVRSGLAAIALLAVVCVLAYLAVSQTMLQAQLTEAKQSLETNRQRKAKQEYEFAEVQKALPLARAELAEKQPLADAAKAEDNALRAERKQLREDIRNLRAGFEMEDADAWAGLAGAADKALSAKAAAEEILQRAENGGEAPAEAGNPTVGQ